MFNSKKFAEHISNSVDSECYYSHLNHEKIISDIETIKYVKIENLPQGEKFFEDDEYFYINTWIAPYFEPGVDYFGECTLRFLYQMYGKIFDAINQKFNTNLKLNEVESYFPEIDYTKYEVSEADKFLSEYNVLVCNGPCLSGQCNYTGNMEDILNVVAKENSDKTFFLTHKINTDMKNVFFTDDIFSDSNGCDLNEISYISTKSKLIIGRNSGPFCFTNTYTNLMDSDKTFFAFGSRETDCFPYGIDINCNFVFEYYDTQEQILNTIKSLLA